MVRVKFLLLCLGCCCFQLSGQVVTCTSGSSGIKSITIHSIICDTNNTLDGHDDHITFSMVGENIEGVNIRNIPSNMLVLNNEYLEFTMDDGNAGIKIKENGQFSLSLPSVSCQPLNLTVDWSDTSCKDALLLVDSRIEIPTLGQWGILILGMSIFIIGFLEIKKGRNRPFYLRTTLNY